MDVYEAIRTRRSITKYSDMAVEWDKIGNILDAGRLSPCAGNIQAWKFVVVMEGDAKKKMADACFQQYWMEKAPVLIVICSEPHKLSRFYGIRGERLYSIQECACVAQNMMLMAHSQGLGSCMVSAFDEEMVKRVVGMPDFARPQSIIVVGYPDEIKPMPQKYTVYDVTFLEKFGNRIADLWAVMGFWSHNVEAGVKDVKQKIEDLEHGEPIGNKIRRHVKGIFDKKK